MVNFRDIIETLIDVGFYEVLLPFILIYAITFGILQKSNIFKGGDGDSHSKNINAVIAFVFGLFFVASLQAVQLIQSFIIQTVVILIFLLGLMIVLGLLFGESYKKAFFNGDEIKPWVAAVVSILVILIAIAAILSFFGLWDTIASWFDSGYGSSETWSTIFVVLIIGLILYWITRSDSSNKKDSE